MRTLISAVVAAFALAACTSPQATQTTSSEPQANPQTPAGPETQGDAEKAGNAQPGAAGAQAHDLPMMTGAMGAMATMCPMKVAGTSVRVSDELGVTALVFSTSEDVEELRRRMARMAEMHNQHHADAGKSSGMHGDGMHGGMHGDGMHGGMRGDGMMMVPPSTARWENTDAGARLVLTPVDATQRQALRAQVEKMAERMQRNECPMMSAHSANASSAAPETHSAGTSAMAEPKR